MRERLTLHCLILYLGACRWRRTVEEHLSDAGAEGTTFHILAKRMDPSRSRLAASRAFHDLLCTIHSLPCLRRETELRSKLRSVRGFGAYRVRLGVRRHGVARTGAGAAEDSLWRHPDAPRQRRRLSTPRPTVPSL